MKIQCNREQLLKVFSAVASVAQFRSSKEILTNVKFVADADRLLLHATDMEVWIVAPVTGVEIERPGAALLPVSRMGQMLKEMPDETVKIIVEDTQIRVVGAHSEFKLPCANPDEYPSVKQFDAEKYHGVMARIFAEAIKKTSFATDPDSSRFALGGVLLEMVGNECQMVGTDGRRLANVTFGGSPVEGHSTQGITSVIVPTRAATIIQRACEQFDGECKVNCSINEIYVEANGVVIGARLVEGRYPVWRNVIPNREADGWNKVELAAGPLGAVVRQASIVADKETRGLDFTFSNGTLIVGGQAQELGESTIEMPIEWDHDSVKLKLDFRFVRDFITVLGPEEKLTMEIARSTQPAVMSTEGYSYIIMPMSQE